MSDTPRTDAFCKAKYDAVSASAAGFSDAVEFARQLERELAARPEGGLTLLEVCEQLFGCFITPSHTQGHGMCSRPHYERGRHMKIDLPLALASGEEATVPAILLPDIAPHLAGVATWALHRGAKCDTAYTRWWFVSSVECGRRVAYNRSKSVAILEAKERLATKTERDVRRAYRKHLRSTPQSGGIE